MAPSNQPFTLRSIPKKDKLNGTKYADWIRNLRIVLRAEKKEEILDNLKHLLIMHPLLRKMLTKGHVMLILK
jgi:hypothetical protein